ncbi:MAG TPA: tetratricopeptide repeat protein [Caulobacteraceae bacterium]|nr:tetratricopeptide repeat protein [Caulobacteraceae bacterium]
MTSVNQAALAEHLRLLERAVGAKAAQAETLIEAARERARRARPTLRGRFSSKVAAYVGRVHTPQAVGDLRELLDEVRHVHSQPAELAFALRDEFAAMAESLPAQDLRAQALRRTGEGLGAAGERLHGLVREAEEELTRAIGPARYATPDPSRQSLLMVATALVCSSWIVLSAPAAPSSRAYETPPPITLRGLIFVGAARPDQPAQAAPKTAGERELAVAQGDLRARRGDAMARIRRLAEAGVPGAQVLLAKLYHDGEGGLAADPVRARRWMSLAADGGEPSAMHNLAVYCLQGVGGARDDAAAVKLFRKAAAAGVADSQYNLGLLYEAGAGVERNLVEAYRWFRIAGNGGDANAAARADQIEGRLSDAEFEALEETAATFSPGGAPPEELKVVAGAETIAQSQLKLARMGYYIGPIDGRDTPAYRQAVAAYPNDRR